MLTRLKLIVTQEFARCGARGYGDGLQGGMVIGLPPVLNFGSEELKAKVVDDVLAGKKFISLAISEAHAGSDVMGLQTTAVKTEDGKEWIINGTKKWITNGVFSDYFTVGCKTEVSSFHQPHFSSCSSLFVTGWFHRHFGRAWRRC